MTTWEKIIIHYAMVFKSQNLINKKPQLHIDMPNFKQILSDLCHLKVTFMVNLKRVTYYNINKVRLVAKWQHKQTESATY